MHKQVFRRGDSHRVRRELGVSGSGEGEASKTWHSTIQVMAEARVAMQNHAWGRGKEEEKAYLSTEVSYLRRRISLANVIAFGLTLAGKMVQVGGQATGRRDWGREEEMARREREAAGEDIFQGHCEEGTVLAEVL